MTMLKKASDLRRRGLMNVLSWLIVGAGIAFLAAPAQAQQAGTISGQVTDSAGAGLADVEIQASGDVLPQARTTSTASNGRYVFRLLPPGNYVLEFTFPDGSRQTRNVAVLLQQTAVLDVSTADAEMEEIVATASALLADTGQGALKNAISADTIDGLPVGQEYRDLMKLIPGVQYTEFTVRGPSAGGSGQDNVYQFDGVDVSLPLFGVLASEPSSHDIAQVSIVRGGAKAIGFNRSGGFTMNTISKRGSNEFHGEVSYQMQSAGMTGDRDTGDSPEEFDEDRTWTTVSLGGPILRDRLFFYASYYRPERTRDNASNAYGPVGDYESIRDEAFAKLTFAPTDSLLFDVSYRTSDRDVDNASVGAFEADSASLGEKATQDILILEGSWIASDRASLNFKYTDYENLNAGQPDRLFNIDTSLGASLDINNLDGMGYFEVPTPIAGEDDYNAFIQPYIDAYGYLDGGTPTGGGAVGGYYQINNQDFFRESFELAFDYTFYTGDATHDFHVGYQWMDIAEDLNRLSNGWGIVSVPGGRVTIEGQPVYFQARIEQQSLFASEGAPSIYSSSELQSFELNDTITRGDWTYNVGVMFSNDVLYGQGLAKNSSNPVTGFEQSPGSKYKMYEVDWTDMIQPRLGVTWDYNDTSSVYLNFSSYNPSASSLARAASWDRNLRRTINVYFDENGDFLTSQDVGSSSGKWFQKNLDPRTTDEWLLGMTKDLSSELTLRAHARYRKSYNFWEDTNNNARQFINAPEKIGDELYIPNLDEIRAEIGGSSFVIAELDGGFTKYYEASLEADWVYDNWFLRGSYTWSHYYGNFDQDNSTTFNDQAIFIGSSNIADDPGRQLWDMKEGNLSGDRRHQFKLYGFYELPWNARAGMYFVAQSGEPWEAWDVEVYRDVLTAAGSGSTSSTIRFAETAGKRTSDAHWQIDLNYTQNFRTFGDQNLQLRVDVFNILDNQTGYEIQPNVYSSGFGDPLSYFRPRRIQVALKYQF